MHIYRCVVVHAGKRDMQIHRDEVTPAEIVLLKAVHGAENVVQIEKVREARVQQAKERDRLISTYGARIFARTYPGASPRLPLTLAEAGLTEDGRDLEAAMAEEPEADEPLPEPSPNAKAIAARVMAKQAGAGGLT